MKNIIIILIAIFSLSAVDLRAQLGEVQQDAYAELTKTERKEWKKIARQYKRNPKTLKALSEEHALLKEINDKLTGELAEAKINEEQFLARLNQYSFETDKLRLDKILLENQLMAARNSIRALSSEEKGDDMLKGIVYRVQIGAFQERELAGDLNNSEMLKLDEKGNLQQVVIGQFRDYNKAKQLKTHLREMGVKDAWIVTYQDGHRINIEKTLNDTGSN